MNILFLTRLYEPHVGGVEKHIGEIGRIIVKKGHKVVVFATKHDKNLEKDEIINGIRVIRFKQPKIKLIGLLYTWVWLFLNNSFIKESDVIHAHDVFIWYLPFRYIFSNHLAFTTFHGWEGKYPVSKRSIGVKSLSETYSWGNIAVGKYIEKYYGIKANIITYGATSVPKFVTKKVKNSIVYVGRLEKDTGLPVFLQSLKNLKEYKVDFCGEGELANECKKYGKVHGFIDPAPFLAKAEICFSSGYLTILEAFAHKSVVVCAYDNKLKRDYYKMTPFSKWIFASDSPTKITNYANMGAKNQKETKITLEASYNWVKKQTWENLTGHYLKLWGVEER